MRYLIVLFALLSAPAQALEYCDELWLTRNLVFDRAGYCFNSVLGQAVFDNTGCDAAGVTLSEADKALVAKAFLAEHEQDCDVDTDQDFLAVPQLKQRLGLVDAPFPTIDESACVGWQGARMELRGERFEDGAVIGAVRKGDALLFQFEDVDGWSFVQVLQNGVPAGMGWAKIDFESMACDALAG